MPRVKRGVTASKRRKNLLRHAKGFKWRRKTNYKAAKEALLHAWVRAFGDRRKKKGDFRRLWQIKINAAARQNGISYSRLINGLKKANIGLDRKVLAALAENEPKVFASIVEEAKKHIETKTKDKKVPTSESRDPEPESVGKKIPA